MNSKPEKAIGKTQSVRTLCKKNGDVQYVRRGEVEEELEALYATSIEELAERSKISDADDPMYVSSEAVLHFVRQSKENDDGPAYETLFGELRQRLLRALPVDEKRLPNSKFAVDPYQQEVRDQVMHKFMKLLCIDRNESSERLHYFEVMFNGAVARLRQTAKRDASERRKREKSEALPDVSGQPSDANGFDEHLRELNEPAENDGSVYRFEVLSAINTLPDDERRVVELLIQGYLLNEVANIVKCTEKTARSRRDRARKKLADVLEREDLL